MRAMVLGVVLVAVAFSGTVGAGDKPADSAKAKKTRELLKDKYTLDIGETELPSVIEEIQEAVKEKTKATLRVKLDTKAGINRNKRLSYKCKDKTLAEVFDELLGKNGWGYYVVSNAKDSQWDGAIWVRPGKERGYPMEK